MWALRRTMTCWMRTFGWSRSSNVEGSFQLNTDLSHVGGTRVQEPLGLAEPDMQDKKIWVAITAHNPLARLDCLIGVIKEYSRYPCEVSIYVYIDFESQGVADRLSDILNRVSFKTVEIKIAPPEFENWYLTWAHKTDLALAIFNRAADIYIYQENDMHLTFENFKYWFKWRPRLKPLGLEPGFVRFENYKNKKVPFDNYFPYSLTYPTPNVWGNRGFEVTKTLVIDRDVDFFVQLANPYYGAMILDQKGGERYIRSASFDPERSYDRVGIRNWPIADRSSMGLAFEDVPAGCEHSRCVPVSRVGDQYVLLDSGLIWHEDDKYSKELEKLHGNLRDCANILTLN